MFRRSVAVLSSLLVSLAGMSSANARLVDVGAKQVGADLNCSSDIEDDSKVEDVESKSDVVIQGE